MKKISYLIFGLWIIFVLNNQAAAVCPLGSNLILNPNAEGNPTAPANGENVDLANWDNETGGFTIFRYSSNTTSGTPPFNSPGGPADRGTYIFGGGNNSANSSGSQTIDVSQCAAEIDGGNQSFGLSGYFGGYQNQNDNSRLTLTFRDANDVSIGTATVGAVLAADRGNATEILYRGTAGMMPVGTRSVIAVLLHTRITGNNNNGLADNLSFILTAPTAAEVTVGGRVMTADKRGIRNALVTLILPSGETRAAISQTFGYYQFDNVEIGSTYIVSVSAKRFSFNNPTRVLTIYEETTNIDFVALEQGIYDLPMPTF